jgi:hypothetical protein
MAALAGVGVFVDFLLGKSGQKSIRDRLESWWYRFDDVKWNNFGSKEAEYCVRLLDSYAGIRLFSWRRLSLSLVAFALAFIVSIGLVVLAGDWSTWRASTRFFWLSQTTLIAIPIYVASFAVSLSVMRLIAIAFTRVGGSSVLVAFAAFLALVLVHIALLIVWSPLVGWAQRGLTIVALVAIDSFERGYLALDSHWPILRLHIQSTELFVRMNVEGFSRDVREIGIFGWLLKPFTYAPEGRLLASVFPEPSPGIQYATDVLRTTLDYMTNGLRILFALAFAASFLAGPIIRRPLSLIWRRVVEADKPVCTLVLGGTAAGAKFAQEAIKHFAG